MAGEQFAMVPWLVIERCDDVCLRIFAFLDLRSGGPNGRPVRGLGYVAHSLRVQERTVSEHVGHLVDAGLIHLRRDGQGAVALSVASNPARGDDGAVTLPERVPRYRKPSRWPTVPRETQDSADDAPPVPRETQDSPDEMAPDCPAFDAPPVPRETQVSVPRETQDALGLGRSGGSRSGGSRSGQRALDDSLAAYDAWRASPRDVPDFDLKLAQLRAAMVQRSRLDDGGCLVCGVPCEPVHPSSRERICAKHDDAPLVWSR